MANGDLVGKDSVLVTTPIPASRDCSSYCTAWVDTATHRGPRQRNTLFGRPQAQGERLSQCPQMRPSSLVGRLGCSQPLDSSSPVPTRLPGCAGRHPFGHPRALSSLGDCIDHAVYIVVLIEDASHIQPSGLSAHQYHSSRPIFV